MRRRPSFQFYPADWQSNPNLRRCTHAEKGIWVDIMCLLADGDEFGILRWPLDELSGAVGASSHEVMGLIRKGVLKGSDTVCAEFIYTPRSGRKDGNPVVLIAEQPGPIWFSSRMVTDEYKAMVREKNFTVATNGESKGGAKDTHHWEHPPRAITPAAPSSSSSSSVKSSEANASGENSPPDLKLMIFGPFLDWLANQTGKSRDSLRSALGRQCKLHGDAAVIEIANRVQKEAPVDPLSWMEKAFQIRGGNSLRRSPRQAGEQA